MRTRASHLLRLGAIGAFLLCVAPNTLAQFNQDCTVSVLNRTVQVNPDGSWVLPNIPANFGQVKARATCVRNGITTSGESDYFTVPANGAVNLPHIVLGAVTAIPGSLSLNPSSPSFNTAGQTIQIVGGDRHILTTPRKTLAQPPPARTTLLVILPSPRLVQTEW